IRETTPLDDLAERAKGYAMPGVIVDGQDVDAVYETVSDAVARARRGEGPTLIEAKTYRYRGHSRTDPAKYRVEGERERWKESDPTVVFMGEDVATAGGVFKTNEGLSDKFGRERVRNTPICENGFVGVALGMAVTGMRPVVEIMFSDFLPTAGDAMVNELPKYRFMSGGQCEVPLTVRSIGGATGRFGTQHSATGEAWFLGLPGLKVATAG